MRQLIHDNPKSHEVSSFVNGIKGSSHADSSESKAKPKWEPPKWEPPKEEEKPKWEYPRHGIPDIPTFVSSAMLKEALEMRVSKGSKYKDDYGNPMKMGDIIETNSGRSYLRWVWQESGMSWEIKRNAGIVYTHAEC